MKIDGYSMPTIHPNYFPVSSRRRSLSRMLEELASESNFPEHDRVSGLSFEDSPAQELTAQSLLLSASLDMFAAHLQFLSAGLGRLKLLLETTERQVIVRTRSPLCLLATPILRNPRAELVYIFDASNSTPATPQLEESIRAATCLAEHGCSVSLLARYGRGNFLSSKQREALSDAGCRWIYPPDLRVSRRQADVLAIIWLKELESSLLEKSAA